jgi:hypothetical protein
MESKLTPFVPLDVLPDDFYLDINDINDGNTSVTQIYNIAISLGDAIPVSLANINSLPVGSVFYRTIASGGLSDDHLKRVRYLKC